MKRSGAALFVLGAALVAGTTAACGLPFSSELDAILNTCESSADCPDGTCKAIDGAQRCVATQADLAGVIFKLEGTTADGVSVSHVFAEGVSIQGPRPDGWIFPHDLDAPAPLALSGRFLQPGDPDPLCIEADSSVPVKVEARPSRELAGLGQVFTGTSTVVTADDGTPTNRFVLPVPAGIYDVYIVPQPLPEGCKTIPPAIFREIEVPVALEPEPEVPLRLTGTVIPFAGRDLAGFEVELVDPERGLPVSETAVLGAPVDGAIPLLGVGDDPLNPLGIAYYSTPGLVLRISDPEGALVVHYSFESLDLDGDGEVVLDLEDLIANPKEFEANVLDVQLRPVAGATVTIKSLELTGSASKNASFQVTTKSGADGKIHVQLVPGIYQAIVIPPTEDGPAILDDEWEITPDSGCCGKSFELASRPLLTGRVATPAGEAVSQVAVLASPSLPATRSYFDSAIESLTLLPRQAATTTDASGTFASSVDPGLYDVTIRATATTGFPWLVLPAVVIAPIEQQPAATLEDLTVPSPALFMGRASAQGVDVAGATLRAFLPLADSDGGSSTPVRVVAIGETIVGDDGLFVLPVPPTVARAVAEAGGTTSSSAATSSATGSMN